MSTPNPGRSLRLPLPFGMSPFALAFLALLVIALIMSFQGGVGEALVFNPSAFQNIAQAFAPMLVAAAFVERAVEVVLTPLRGDRADLLQQAAQAAASAAATDPARAPDATRLANDLLNYKQHTRHYAFLLSSTLGIVAALVGFRGLSTLLANAAAAPVQFRAYDILLTGLLIGGGADGMHKLMSAILGYLDLVTSSTQQQKAAQQQGLQAAPAAQPAPQQPAVQPAQPVVQPQGQLQPTP